MRLPVAVAAAFLAVASAPGAAAAPATTVQLKIGDAVDVVGTKIACFALKSNGKAGVGCLLWGKNRPLTGSYAAGISVDGTTVISRVKADGTSVDILKRKPQSAARAAKVYRLRVGDAFGFPISSTVNLGCKIIDVTSTAVAPIYRGVKVSCWHATETAPIPKTWGISISDKMAGVFQFDARGEVSPKGVMRKQPR